MILYEAIGYSTSHYESKEERVAFRDLDRIRGWMRGFLAAGGRKVIFYRRERYGCGWRGGKRKKIAEWTRPEEVPA